MAFILHLVLILIFENNVLALDAQNKRLVLQEMDIEQEIINLKQSLAQKDTEISTLQKENAALQLQIGSIYTRWGRTSCAGNGTTLAYSDIAEEFAKLKEELQQQKEQIQNLTAKLNAKDGEVTVSGSLYTRWGRTSCPGNGTTLVYSGYMTGTYNDKVGHGPGSGANYLCLADQPTWDYYSDTANNDIHITGVQYEFTASGQDHDLQTIFGANIRNSEAPCSVCRTRRNTNVMIPGRKDCYPGWTKEYSGYLVGGAPSYDDSTEYICLDRRPETIVHSGDRNNDNMLYFVEAFCGKSLECPPYIHNRELACVVCSM